MRTRKMVALIGILLLVVALTLPATAGTRWALVVGVDKCKAIGELKVCAADARSLAVLLPKVGYDAVCLLTDDSADFASWPTIGNLERSIQRIAKVAGPGDSILFFFSGHGVTREGEGFLVPSDGDAKRAVSLSWVKEQFIASKATEKTIIIDACHAGAAKGITGIVPSATGVTGLVMLLSCDRDEVSWPDESVGHSVFTTALLQGLGGKAADKDRTVSAEKLYGYVKQHVVAWTFRNGKELQTPVLVGETGTRQQLARCPAKDVDSTLVSKASTFQTNSYKVESVSQPTRDWEKASSVRKKAPATFDPRTHYKDWDVHCYPLQLGVLAPLQLAPEESDITGIRLNMYGINRNVTGLDIGLISQSTGHFRGIAMGYLFPAVNIAEDCSGIELGMTMFTANWVKNDMSGLQIAGLLGFNRAMNMSGVQIGIINYCETMVGLQIGLINVITESPVPFLPLLNAHF